MIDERRPTPLEILGNAFSRAAIHRQPDRRCFRHPSIRRSHTDRLWPSSPINVQSSTSSDCGLSPTCDHRPDHLLHSWPCTQVDELSSFRCKQLDLNLKISLNSIQKLRAAAKKVHYLHYWIVITYF